MIEEYKFGSFRIDGKSYLDDVKIINGKAKSYTITDHRKGLTLEDIKDIIQIKPKFFVIGSGATGMLAIAKDVKDFLRSLGVQVIVEKTTDAVKTVNRYVEEKKDFCAFLHATS